MGGCKKTNCKTNKVHLDGLCSKCYEDRQTACGICSTPCTDTSIQCEYCEIWFHASCKNLTKEDFNTISSTNGLHWFCPKCESKVEEKIICSTSLNQLKVLMETQNHELKIEIEDLSKIKERLDAVENKIADSLTSMKSDMEKTHESAKKFSDLFKIDSTSTETVTKSIAKQTVGEINRLTAERENREKNIIIFKVAEKENAEERKKSDREFFDDLCDQELGLEIQTISSITRIGTYVSSKTRPLKVSFQNTFDKRKFLSSLYKLKNEASKYKSINVQHDMTLDERAESKNLLKTAYELNQRKDNQETIYKVRGPPWAMKIIKLKRKQPSQSELLT